MMTPLYLKPGVYAAVVEADLVLLDVASDAYLCLPDGASMLGGDPSGALRPGTLRDALRAAGLVCEAPGPAVTTPAKPRRSVIHEVGGFRPDARVLAAATGAVLDVRQARRRKGVGAYLAVAGETGRLGRDQAGVEDAARRFWALSPWLPIEGECLVRSALLVSFLRRMGLAADWVFAVRLWPFSAHCWVQVGDVCLNDDAERLVPFTPIFSR